MKRKLMVSVFLFFACSTMVCGCENGGEKNDSTTLGKEDLYGFDEPFNVKFGVGYAIDFEWQGGETYTDNVWIDLYKEHNIYPEFLYNVEMSQLESKLSSAILSGNYPDIFQTDTVSYVNYVEDGVVADITEAYETYASDQLKEYLMSDGGVALKQLTIDGKLYGLPRLANPYEEYSMMFIRKDWLDNLGLSIPKTTEELKEVAYAFTHMDPDGNGKDDTCGLVLDGVEMFSGTIGNSDGFFNSFEAYFGQDGMAMVENDNGEVVWGGSNSEAVKEALTYLQEMYADGSLCKDFLYMDGDGIFEAAGNGHCGIWFGPHWAGMVPSIQAAKTDKDAHIIALPLVNASNHVAKAYLPSTISEIHCVSSKCERPEVLIKMMNLSVAKICYPENEEEYLKYVGEEEHYSGWKTSLTQVKDINRGYQDWQSESKALLTGDTSELDFTQMDDVEAMFAYLNAKENGTFDPYDKLQQTGISYYTVHGDEHCAWQVIDTMMKEKAFISSGSVSLPSVRVTKNTGLLKKLAVESMIKIITGDSVETWDNVLETWYNLGGKEAVEEANKGKKVVR